MHWLMAAAIGLLSLAGVLFVYSAGYAYDEAPVALLYRRQAFWVMVGIAVLLGVAAFDYRRIQKASWWLYLVSLVLLVFVLLFGQSRGGAQRWLVVFGVQIQPSELAKFATIMVLAQILGQPRAGLDRFRSVLGILFVAALPVLLIMKQPDLGTAMVFVPVVWLMLFVGGVSWRIMCGLTLAGVLAVALVVSALFVPMWLGWSEERQARMIRMTGLSEYQRERVLVFIQPGRDPLGRGWNKMQSEIAVGSGGMHGKGYLHGTQNILGFLPRSVAHTDFIYSVIAEETGFVGSMAVLALFVALVGCILHTAVAARDKVARLLCVGIGTLVFCHVFINIAMTVGLMPITGLPLPLLSYGGSFMVTLMGALGLVQSVYIRSRSVRGRGMY